MIGNAQSSRGTGKLLALLVTLCLLLSLVPVSGFGFAEDMDAGPASGSEAALAEGSDDREAASGEENQAISNDEPSAAGEIASDAGSVASGDAVGSTSPSDPTPSGSGAIVPLAGEIAYLTGSVTTTPVDPLSGAAFKMTIELNSNSTGASTTEGLKDAKVSFTIPSNVEIQSLPTSNGQYTVSPANPQPGDTVTIAYSGELSVGSLHKLECWFRFPAGVSLESESFKPAIEFTASNAFSHSMVSDEVNPQNLPLEDVMKVTPQLINPIFLHTAEIDLTREAYLGGLNQNDASVKIEFPGDAEVLSVTYGGVDYPVVDDGLGGKVATIPIGTLAVGNQGTKEKITDLYS